MKDFVDRRSCENRKVLKPDFPTESFGVSLTNNVAVRCSSLHQSCGLFPLDGRHPINGMRRYCFESSGKMQRRRLVFPLCSGPSAGQI